jgi:hypothetical protein
MKPVKDTENASDISRANFMTGGKRFAKSCRWGASQFLGSLP